MEKNCPICGNPLEPADNLGLKKGDYEFLNCAHSCGRFKISRSLLKSLPKLLQEDGNRVFLLKHFLRKMQDGKEIPYLDSYLIEKVFRITLPSLPDQSRYLVLWLGDHTGPGESVEESCGV
jgi:hypothetical protein